MVAVFYWKGVEQNEPFFFFWFHLSSVPLRPQPLFLLSLCLSLSLSFSRRGVAVWFARKYGRDRFSRHFVSCPRADARARAVPSPSLAPSPSPFPSRPAAFPLGPSPSPSPAPSLSRNRAVGSRPCSPGLLDAPDVVAARARSIAVARLGGPVRPWRAVGGGARGKQPRRSQPVPCRAAMRRRKRPRRCRRINRHRRAPAPGGRGCSSCWRRWRAPWPCSSPSSDSTPPPSTP